LTAIISALLILAVKVRMKQSAWGMPYLDLVAKYQIDCTLQQDKFFSITCNPNTTDLVLQNGEGRRLIQPPANQSVVGY
jgi:hypothetical protein